MTHIFRNSISGDVLGSYQGSHTETVEAIAEAAGMNIKLHDIVERDEDETSLVRKNPLSLLENKHPQARKMRMCHGCEKQFIPTGPCKCSCRLAHYCGTACQKAHWAVHKLICDRGRSGGDETCCRCITLA